MTYQDRDRVIAWLDAGHGDELKPIDRVVLMELATQTNGHTGLAWPGRDWFVKRWGWGGKSIEAAIVRLHKLGLIEIVERGMWRRRTRYRVTLLQAIGPNPLGPMEASVGPSQQGDRSYPARSQVLAGKDRLSESSRSQSGEMTTDGATRLAPVRSLSAAPRDVPGGIDINKADIAIHREIMAALSCSPGEATDWAKTKVAGKNPRNIDAYLRKCLANHIAETHRKPAAETHRKPATKKTGGEFSCPRCGRGFPSKSSLGSHAGHCATENCPDCGEAVKARDLREHRRLVHGIDLWAERRSFVDGLVNQPPCIHGQPGGNIPQPGNTEDAGWMRCPLCRNNAQRSA
jgi:transcription elongation factor Elf1